MRFEPATLLFFIFFGAIVVTFAYRIVRYRGFKAAMFGASIDRTVGEVEGTGTTLGRVRLRVHALSGGRDRAVGVELVATTIASYQMLPITLSVTDTEELIALLKEAAASDQSKFT